MRRKVTTEICRELARNRGGEFLSPEYTTEQNKCFEWRCHKGHIWSAPYGRIYSGSWCPECRKSTIEEAIAVARSRGGECLSTKYVNIFSKLMWKCSCGHVWEASLNNVKNNGSWCIWCAGKDKNTLEDAREVAKKRGGDCLSLEYSNCMENLVWRCDKDHAWEASYNSVSRGTWCPQCSGNEKPLIGDCVVLAKTHGGLCLSTEYKNNHAPMLWKCDKGHIWEACYSSIKNNGSWCPYCSCTAKKSIEDAKDLALSKKGLCLSLDFINVDSKLLWKCEKGHTWEATYDNVRASSWCPYCTHHISKPELEIREYIISNCKLAGDALVCNSQRIIKPYELDIYIPHINFAIEFNGQRHHSFEGLMRRYKGDVEKAKNYHKMKTDMCSALGITLMYIDEKDWIADKKVVLESVGDEIGKRLSELEEGGTQQTI